MPLYLKLSTSILTPTGNGWVIRDGADDFFINYRQVHGTRKDGDGDYVLTLNDLDVDALGLRKYVAG